MKDLPKTPATAAPVKAPTPHAIAGHLRTLVRILVHSPRRGQVLFLFCLIGTAIIGNAIGQVRLNVWNGRFYDALSSKNIDVFVSQLLLFLEIIAGLVVVGVMQKWSQEMIKVRLREALTRDLFDEWLKPKRAYTLANMGEIAVNPDQRVQEDARHLTELSVDLTVGLLQSTLLLASFIGVLWVLSDEVKFNIHGRGMVVPGYMVWCALIYAFAGSVLTWAVGRPLIALNSDHYSKEATFRFSLVRFNESAEGIALQGGEPMERQLLIKTLDSVLEIMRRLANRLANLQWVTATYGFIAIVVPVVVASPGFFAGTLSFGGLMMVVGAFYQVQQALRWFIDNFSVIADWHATFARVMNFRAALVKTEAHAPGAHTIDVSTDVNSHLRFHNFGMVLGTSAADLEETDVDIKPGERVQIVGGLGSGKTTLFRVLAGLTDAGFGSVSRPPLDDMVFLPQRPYLPLGTMKTALTYPGAQNEIDDDSLFHALARVGLNRFTEGSLDQMRRWDRDLTQSEQQCLAFARLLIHRPPWVILDGAFDTLDDASRQQVLSIFSTDLRHTGVVSIGEALLDHPFFGRTLHLHRRSPVAESQKQSEAVS